MTHEKWMNGILVISKIMLNKCFFFLSSHTKFTRRVNIHTHCIHAGCVRFSISGKSGFRIIGCIYMFHISFVLDSFYHNWLSFILSIYKIFFNLVKQFFRRITLYIIISFDNGSISSMF